MRKFLKDFKNPNEERLNLKLIKREYDKELVTYVVNVFKSLDSTGMIKFLGYTVEYDESKIDYSKYITSRKKKKKKDGNIKYQFIKDNRVFELTMDFKVEVNGEVKYVRKTILLPKKDKNNYYMLKGTRYFLLYQLVDSSTYVVKDGLVFKSLMPIVVMFKPSSIKDTDGNEYPINNFFMKIFKREISALLFYFSKLGFRKTLIYFMVDKIIYPIKPDEVVKDDPDYIYFNANRHVVLKVNRHFFSTFEYVKAMIRMIQDCFVPKTNFDNLENHTYWIEQLGALYTKTNHKMYESGKSTIVFFERLLDLTSKDALKVSEVNKISVYSVVRWMLQNFPELRQKNNLDLSTKRLRLNECIASMLSMHIGKNVNRNCVIYQ